MARGQVIVFGTDGIWEAHSPQQEMFGKARVHEVIRRHCQATAATIRDQLFEAVAAFMEKRRFNSKWCIRRSCGKGLC